MKPVQNRCPDCGSVVDHMVTDILGNQYFQCSGGIGTLKYENQEFKPGAIKVCEAVVDEKGKKVTATIAYRTYDDNPDFNKQRAVVRTLTVEDGKLRR